MELSALGVGNVRVLRRVRMEPGPGLNFVVGANGSGKTSLLEAVYLLGRGRSFRGRGRVVTWGETELVVWGEGEMQGGGSLRVEVRKGDGGGRIKVGAKEVRSSSELSKWLPMVLVTPERQTMLTEGREGRRGLMDWVVFHVEPGYLDLYQRYRGLLRQRNAALRADVAGDEQEVWEGELGKLGEALSVRRREVVGRLRGFVEASVERLGVGKAELSYYQGWKEGQGLCEALAGARRRDRALGFTGVGPQRGDLRLAINGELLGSGLSRGELKRAVYGLCLGVAEYLEAEGWTRPVVLIDELAGELDGVGQKGVIGELERIGAQSFVTQVGEGRRGSGLSASAKQFHVEQGVVRELV